MYRVQVEYEQRKRESGSATALMWVTSQSHKLRAYLGYNAAADRWILVVWVWPCVTVRLWGAALGAQCGFVGSPQIPGRCCWYDSGRHEAGEPRSH